MRHLYHFAKSFLGLACLVLFLSTSTAFAQTTAFSHKGRLNDDVTGMYTMQFKLFDAEAGGNQIGTTLTFGIGNPLVMVTNGVYSVLLDFGAEPFAAGAKRYLQAEVSYSGEAFFDPLTPRREITSTPYAIRSLSAAAADNANTASNATMLDGVAASNYVQTADPRLYDARQPTPGSSDYIQNRINQQQLHSSFNISGDGRAGGWLSGENVNAETSYALGGRPMLRAGDLSLFAGFGAGASNPTGIFNSFFGQDAGHLTTSGYANSFFGGSTGKSNTTGIYNSFFGNDAGLRNTTGSNNSFFGGGTGQFNTGGTSNAFFGTTAGYSNTTGGANSFFGESAGQGNTEGSQNAFFGWGAGRGNMTGNFNTIIGNNANVNSVDLNYATAIGAGSIVDESNTVVLGRSEDTVRVPGSLVVVGTFNLPPGSTNYLQNTTDEQASTNFNISGNGTAGGMLTGNTVNASTQYNLGGQRMLSAPGANNLFVGLNAGRSNTNGFDNSFFGQLAGEENTTGIFNSFFGMSAGQYNTTGVANSFVGTRAGQRNTAGSFNSFFGTSAGEKNESGGGNSFVGAHAGRNNTTGGGNSFVGASAGENNTEGSSNSFFGGSAGAGNTTGSSNSFFGGSAGRSNTSGQDNSFVGVSAGQGNTLGQANSFFGKDAGQSNTEGNYNSFVGVSAGQSNTLGQANSFFGKDAGQGNTEGSYNSFVGMFAGRSSTTGNRNSFVGSAAGEFNRTGEANSFFGAEAGQENTTGQANSFVGASAGRGNTQGQANSFFGAGAGRSNWTGNFNTIIGNNANVNSVDLNYATAIGADSIVDESNTVVLGRSDDTVRVPGKFEVRNGTITVATLGAAGSTTLCRNALNQIANCSSLPPPVSTNYIQNTMNQQSDSNFNISGNGTAGGTLSGNIVNAATQYNLGDQRVLSAPGTNNLFTGIDAGQNNTTGANNSFFGALAGQNSTSGNGNSFFGRNTGQGNISGDSNTLIGNNANVGNGNLHHATAIGAGSVVDSSNSVVLGRNIDVVRVPGDFVGKGTITVSLLGPAGQTHLCRNASNLIATCSSSLRYKTNIASFSSGLNMVSRLRPISFDWKEGGLRDVGFGAEEVAAINPLFVSYNSKGQVEGVKYDRLSVAFVNAFKEQQTQIEQQQDQIRLQQNQIDALRKLVCLDHPNAVVCK